MRFPISSFAQRLSTPELEPLRKPQAPQQMTQIAQTPNRFDGITGQPLTSGFSRTFGERIRDLSADFDRTARPSETRRTQEATARVIQATGGDFQNLSSALSTGKLDPGDLGLMPSGEYEKIFGTGLKFAQEGRLQVQGTEALRQSGKTVDADVAKTEKATQLMGLELMPDGKLVDLANPSSPGVSLYDPVELQKNVAKQVQTDVLARIDREASARSGQPVSKTDQAQLDLDLMKSESKAITDITTEISTNIYKSIHDVMGMQITDPKTGKSRKATDEDMPNLVGPMVSLVMKTRSNFQAKLQNKPIPFPEIEAGEAAAPGVSSGGEETEEQRQRRLYGGGQGKAQ